ncbi:hypothetical protein [Aurantiacibacter spongiae]|uniref:Uncharacterized protein n=1 Tax=Aurantiacibacter spongiae TaxID=2488860 RepID=A0A3N5CT55_9SPHN|nr:hypothetical protein [Aurantiacibacter spongiae]RPF72363.1 hypothetical protein EG799_12555 [Aurantiacibacter spongiae]
MKQPGLALLAAACLTLTACDAQKAGQTEPDAAQSLASPDIVANDLTDGSIGPIGYDFDASVLSRAEVDVPLPPDFDEPTYATKFIPTELLDNIGTAGCSYGDSPDDSECTAEEEVGLALALLDRPYADYVADASLRELGGKPRHSASVAGREGFGLTWTNGATTVDFTYLPAGERTLVVIDRTEDGTTAGREALAQVRDSLDFSALE